MSTNVTTYYWVVYFSAKYVPQPAKAPGAAGEPSPDFRAKHVTVIHRDLYTTHTARFAMPRNGDDVKTDYYKGDQNRRIVTFDFHPSMDEAIKWMQSEWPNLQAKKAEYAELHTFEISAASMAGFPTKP